MRQYLPVTAEHFLEALQAWTVADSLGTESLVTLCSAETVPVDLGPQVRQVQIGGCPGCMRGDAAPAVDARLSSARFGIDFERHTVRLCGTAIGTRLRPQTDMNLPMRLIDHQGLSPDHVGQAGTLPRMPTPGCH